MHEGLFLAASLGGMLVARAMPDGRFTVLHNLARPPDTREGCLPYATWQPRTPASRPASSSPRCYAQFSPACMLIHLVSSVWHMRNKVNATPMLCICTGVCCSAQSYGGIAVCLVSLA